MIQSLDLCYIFIIIMKKSHCVVCQVLYGYSSYSLIYRSNIHPSFICERHLVYERIYVLYILCDTVLLLYYSIQIENVFCI